MNNLQLFESKEIQSNPIIQSAFSTMKESDLTNLKLSVLDLMGNEGLTDIPVQELVTVALKATAMGLPISKELGLAYVLPFNKKIKGKNGQKDTYIKSAVLVPSVKSFRATALETGLVTVLNSGEVYDGEIQNRNRMTGMFDILEEFRKSNTIIGYFAYIELINGFKKMFFMSVEDLKAHALKYSKESVWENGRKTDEKKMPTFWINEFGKMAEKTVMKQLLKAVPLLNRKGTKLSKMLSEDEENILFDEDGTVINTAEPQQSKETSKQSISDPITEEENPFDDEPTIDEELENALNTKIVSTKNAEINGLTLREYVATGEKSVANVLRQSKKDGTDDFTKACKVFAEKMSLDDNI